MNIQQYYEQSATASLNASLVALIPPILILIYSIFIIEFYQLLILIIPFLIYSFSCYQVYLVNHKRSKTAQIEWKVDNKEKISLLDESTFLLTFLPAPSLRLLLFNSGGIKIGELRDCSFFMLRWFLPYFFDRLLVRKFGLYDQNENLVFYYVLYKDRLEILSTNDEKIATVYTYRKGNSREFVFNKMSVKIEKEGFPADYSFTTYENTIVARIQSGLMPVEWGKRFANPNTPILKIDQHLTEMEKVQILSILITLYRYRDH